MYFGYNNQFIKAIRSRPILKKKNTQKIFCFLLVSEIKNLYVKHISDIKEVVSFI
jgi:hypothetical protein